MDSGKWIRELREERFVKSSDIERISRSIADIKGNADFYVSHSTLAESKPGLYPAFTSSSAWPPASRFPWRNSCWFSELT